MEDDGVAVTIITSSLLDHDGVVVVFKMVVDVGYEWEWWHGNRYWVHLRASMIDAF